MRKRQSESRKLQNIRRILIPFDFHDIPRTERWLREMAEQGLFFAGIRGSFALFESDEPKAVRYLLVPALVSRNETAERRKILAQYGWNYICDYPNYLQVYCTADASAVIPTGLYTSAGQVYEEVGRHSGTAASVFAVTSLAAILLIVFMAIAGGRFLISAVEGVFAVPTALLLVDIIFILSAFSDMRSHRLLLSRLRAGMLAENKAECTGDTSIQQSAGSSTASGRLDRLRLASRVAALALCLLAAVFAVVLGFSSLQSQLQSGNSSAVSPILAEAYDLFEELEEYSEHDSVSNASVSVQSGSSLLAPVFCTIHLEDTFEDRTWENSTLSYRPSLKLQYYELRSGWLTNPLFDALMEQYLAQIFWDGEVSRTVITQEGYERLILLTDGVNTSCLFGIRGNNVFVVSYYGETTLSE